MDEEFKVLIENTRIYAKELIDGVTKLIVTKLAVYENQMMKWLQQAPTSPLVEKVKNSVKHYVQKLITLKLYMEDQHLQISMEDFELSFPKLEIQQKPAEFQPLPKEKIEFKFPCSWCLFRGVTDDQLQEHLRNKHLKLKRTLKTTPAELQYQKPQKQALPPQRLDYVDRKFKRFQRDEMQGQMYTCVECSQIFEGPTRYTQHLRQDHNIMEWYVCPNCKQRFAELKETVEHIVQNHSGKMERSWRFLCPFTNLIFKKKYYMQQPDLEQE